VNRIRHYWKNIYFAARCLIETIALLNRRNDKENARKNETTTDGAFQQYDAVAQHHILMIPQYVPDLSYYTIVQSTVDVILLQMISGGEPYNVQLPRQLGPSNAAPL
jgi:hypothetical protein